VTFAVDRRDQVLLLLLLVGAVQDVVGGAAELERNERAAGLHGDDGAHHGAEVDPAVLLGGSNAPESGGLGLLLEILGLLGREAGAVLALVAQHLRLERDDFLLHEGADGVAHHLLFVGKREIDHL
jgi:hypothetical protein